MFCFYSSFFTFLDSTGQKRIDLHSLDKCKVSSTSRNWEWFDWSEEEESVRHTVALFLNWHPRIKSRLLVKGGYLTPPYQFDFTTKCYDSMTSVLNKPICRLNVHELHFSSIRNKHLSGAWLGRSCELRLSKRRRTNKSKLSFAEQFLSLKSFTSWTTDQQSIGPPYTQHLRDEKNAAFCLH